MKVKNIMAIMLSMVIAFVAGYYMSVDINTGQIINQAKDVEIVEVEVVKEVVVTVPTIVEIEKEVLITDTETEIIYIELPCTDCETQLVAMATHQDYLDWFEDYEELVDDFIDELYRKHANAFDLVEDCNRYLQSILDNGGTLDATQVEFMMEYEELRHEWFDFEEWLDEVVDPAYWELMDEFPTEEATE